MEHHPLLPRRIPVQSTEPLTMGGLSQTHRGRSAETRTASDTPIRLAVTIAAGMGDTRTLHALSMGEIPDSFVDPLADHLRASREEGVAGGGFEIFSWLREAAKARLDMISTNARSAIGRVAIRPSYGPTSTGPGRQTSPSSTRPSGIRSHRHPTKYRTSPGRHRL